MELMGLVALLLTCGREYWRRHWQIKNSESSDADYTDALVKTGGILSTETAPANGIIVG